MQQKNDLSRVSLDQKNNAIKVIWARIHTEQPNLSPQESLCYKWVFTQSDLSAWTSLKI